MCRLSLLLVCCTLSACAAPVRCAPVTGGNNNANGPQFDLDTALAMVSYSGAAYCPTDQLQDWSCAPACQSAYSQGFQITKMVGDRNTGTQTFGYLGQNQYDSSTILAFEGTEYLENFITDLKAIHCNFSLPNAPPGVLVHEGFFKAYNSVRLDVIEEIQRLQQRQPGFPVYITGHSLGAALAILAAVDITETIEGFPPVVVYTFGSPRVGNQAFAEYVDQSDSITNFRLTHNEDIVPHLPLEMMGFQHTALEIYQQETYTGLDSLTICDGSGEDPNCADQNTGYSVSDHLDYLNNALGIHGCSGSGIQSLRASAPQTMPLVRPDHIG